MPQNIIPLIALLGLVGGAIWFFNIEPPPPLPACDDAAQTEAMVEMLADAATTLIHETRERGIRTHLALNRIVEDPEVDDVDMRVCDAALEIAARGALPANAYLVRYAIERPESRHAPVTPRLTDLRRTQLPPCDAPDLFDALLEEGAMWKRRSVGKSVIVSEMRETAFDAAAQKRRCAGRARGALDPPTETRPFTGQIGWNDRERATLRIEAWFE